MATSTELISNIRHWWLFLLRGLLFVILGIYMINSPVASYIALSFIFGVVIIIGGLVETIHAYANRYIVGWNLRFLVGLVDLALGIVLVCDLKISLAILPFAVGLWFLFRGFSLFSFASVVSHSAWMLLAGFVTVLFALLIIFNPAFGAMTIVLWTAAAFIAIGIFNAFLAFKLKAVNDVLTKR